MKGFGGSKRANLAGLVTVDKVVRFALSFPQVCTHCIGVDKMEFVEPAVAASHMKPMTPEERTTFMASCARQGGYLMANYLRPGHRDGIPA